jgi:16S rRNA (uracil1498-N3)-methyltransferase
MKLGDQVWLFDENGTEYLARVEETTRNKTRLFVMEKKEKKEPLVKITLTQSLIKTSRLEFLLQKSTEIGVNCFLPVISSRSIVKVEGKIEKKLKRWSRIVREAAKQSGNTNIPKILPPKPLGEILDEDEDSLKIFLNEQGGTYLREILLGDYDLVKQGMDSFSSVRVLIGPEGGWTEQEEQDILDHGFKAISLGPQTMRAETAAISCLVLINHFWNL